MVTCRVLELSSPGGMSRAQGDEIHVTSDFYGG